MMYARYIPPKKEVKGNEEPQAPKLPQNPVNSSGLYARYVPPPKAPPPPQKRKILFDDDNSEPPLKASQDEDPAERKPKRSKHRPTGADDEIVTQGARQPPTDGEQSVENETTAPKRKSKKRKADEQANFSVAESKPYQPSIIQSRASQELDGQSTHISSPDGKKEEKQGKTKESETRQGSGDITVEIMPSRHKSLLEKKDKSLRKSKSAAKAAGVVGEGTDTAPTAPAESTEDTHGLGPLPQPEPTLADSAAPTYETLPPWLANPIRVSPDTRAPFSELGMGPEFGVDPHANRVLQAKGWKEAFAVQTAVIPLLLPSRERQGDLVISAATGSGKTLAYVLPIVRDISRGALTSLRAVVVVPTRELVQQVQEVCETCARAYASHNSKRVRIGISMGSQSFKKEQAALMAEEQIYDPEGYEDYLRRRRNWPNAGDRNEELDLQLFDDSTQPLPHHVIRHVSKVDILICTPGRLVEHLSSTPGFTLDFVRWLVVDEADKLLSQSFQQWLEIVIGKLGEERRGAREFEESSSCGVRKVVLSATMTRDLSLLDSLKLSRPRHVVLEGTRKSESEATTATEYALPELLRESAIKVREESQKPLYLAELLSSRHMASQLQHSPQAEHDAAPTSSSEDDELVDDNDSMDDVSDASQEPFGTSALIFTKSNESALRLSRLLAILLPNLEPVVGTLTSTTRTSERRKTIQSFRAGKTRILVASDLTARGIDLPDLDHVINYDMPPSVEVYVHRVGRAARAGRRGHAWTLFTKKEAGWFWPEVAGIGKGRGGGKAIKRVNKVENTAIRGTDHGGTGTSRGWRFSEERVAQYEAALGQLGEETRKKGDRAHIQLN